MLSQSKGQDWLRAQSRTVRDWLAHRPAAVMFPTGLAVGSVWATLAVLGIGGWGGALVCALLLAAVLGLLIGAEPVMRQFPQAVAVPAPGGVDREESPAVALPPAYPATIRTVEEIPGLLTMVELPGGTFRMGSPEDDVQAYDDERPQHEVTISDFAIGCDVVTRQLYRQIMGSGSRLWEGDEDETLPANHLTWFEAVAFCNRLSERQGLTPCYDIRGRAVEWDQDADGYRLPTEAEWEYAARVGTTTRWFCGDESTELARYAWFDEEYTGRPHPVGRKAPNPWGLYDMAGNVWEWCWDWFADYDAEAVTDPVGPSRGGSRVLRGGAYWDLAEILRSACRKGDRPEDRNLDVGFRVVRCPCRQP